MVSFRLDSEIEETDEGVRFCLPTWQWVQESAWRSRSSLSWHGITDNILQRTRCSCWDHNSPECFDRLSKGCGTIWVEERVFGCLLWSEPSLPTPPCATVTTNTSLHERESDNLSSHKRAWVSFGRRGGALVCRGDAQATRAVAPAYPTVNQRLECAACATGVVGSGTDLGP